MELSKGSKLYKWAFWMEKEAPTQTSLCELFWRVVLLSPMVGASVGTMGALLAVVMSPVWIPALIYSKWSGKTFAESASAPFIALASKKPVKWAAEKKRKVCPLIQIKG